ncbi:hypothetical protein [Dactylosporangium sp. NPDC005555]|uniref:hypothetical protein n=1 Tax=Dactylosporangium sp. NPDC005555 TaxID=3154889 RepID=UPI0033BDCB44
MHELMRSLGRRIEASQQSPDPLSLLGDDAMREAADLWAAQWREDAGVKNLPIAHTIAWLHWSRFKALPVGEDEADLDLALMVFAWVVEVAPQFVNGEVRDALTPGGRDARLALKTLHVVEYRDEPDLLDRAIDLGRRSLAPVGLPPANVARRSTNLGNALMMRYERRADPADLTAGVEAHRNAADAAHPADEVWPLAQSNLGNALLLQAQFTGDREQLDEAVEATRAAWATTPHHHPDLVWRCLNLGNSLRTRFERTAALADLDEMVRVLREAVALAPDGHVDRPMFFSGLTAALGLRFAHHGELEDLDAAVDAARAAVDACPLGRADRHRYLTSLSVMLERRYRRQRQAEDIDEAVAVAEAAVAQGSHHVSGSAARMSNLGGALSVRAGATGTIEDADAAVVACREAVRLGSARQGHLNLSDALHQRFELAGDLSDLTEAAATIRAALADADTGDPGTASLWLGLGLVLFSRFQRTGEEGDVGAALHALRTAASGRSPGHAMAMRAGAAWGLVAATVGAWSSAAEGYGVAVGKLTEAAWPGLRRDSQEQALRDWSGLSADATAAMIAAGSLGAAVETAEQGRGVLWAQLLQTRTTLGDLRAAAPALAARLDGQRRALAAAYTVD